MVLGTSTRATGLGRPLLEEAKICLRRGGGGVEFGALDALSIRGVDGLPRLTMKVVQAGEEEGLLWLD